MYGGSLFRRLWPALVAAATLPVTVLGVGLVTTPAAGADTVSTLASTVPPSTPPVTPAPPAPPTLLRATQVTSTSVTLSWTAAVPGCCDITGYTIGYFQAFYDLGETARVGNVTTATITLKPATQYRFYVQASDSGGHSSPSSNPLTIVTPATDAGPDTVPPSAPGTLTVSDVTATSATLNWTPSTDNVAVTGYNVYRWDGVFVSTLVATVPGTSHTLSLAPSVPNRYYVRARDAAGNVSIATNDVRIDPPTGPTTSPPGPTTSPPGPTCAVTYQKQSEWPGGFVANVTVKNTATTAVTGWTLAFTFPGDQRITTLWSATYTQSGSAVTIRNAGWNGTIAAGASVSFGFQATWSGSNATPTNFSLNDTPCR
ncbi:cellulose binding domain-containing protein [Micromonospora sp. NBC_00421]|uniref:cellulose binding domain-containing protein n=1 Tax=Micromonospora sp. NBC_00421 TaxID=2975976 RepID=UPI002E1B24CA